MDATLHQKIDPSLFPSCLASTLRWFQIANWKKIFLIAFRQILSKILSVVHIFSFIITTYLKKFTGSKSLSTKQCSAELSSWIIPHVFPFYEKCIPSFHLASCQYHIWTAYDRFRGNLEVGGRIRLSSKKSTSPNRNFHVITQ